MPKISVIICVYNGATTIARTLDSVLNQSLTDFELIIINDGSKDNTLKIISAFNDRRIQFFSYPNRGLATSRNRGLAKATGEYISFLDADDIWSVDKLESQISALEENPNAGVAYSWVDRIDEDDRIMCQGGHHTATGNVLPHLLLADITDSGSNALIRKSAFEKVGNYEESMSSGQDWDMAIRLAACYDFVVLPRVQVFYRASSSSISANVLRLEAGCLKTIDRAFKISPDSLQYLKRYSLANLYKYLTFQALKHPISRRRDGLLPFRFLWLALWNDPKFIEQTYLIGSILLKSTIRSIFPVHTSNQILHSKLTCNLSYPEELLMYMHGNPTAII
ncbi:MAG: glycosyltransferase [Geitlerinemataceae cyanobacterium]